MLYTWISNLLAKLMGTLGNGSGNIFLITENKNHSSIVPVNLSILGPLLFLVFINDLPDEMFESYLLQGRVTVGYRQNTYFNESNSIQMNFCSSRQPSTYTLAGSYRVLQNSCNRQSNDFHMEL